MIAWWEGEVRDAAVAPFDLTDRGLTLGDGLFETLLACAGAIDQIDAHVARMTASADALGIPADPAAIRAAAQELAGRTGAQGGVIRLTLTRGRGERGLALPAEPRPVLFGVLAPYRPQLAFSPVRLATASARRNDQSPTSRLKTLGYLDAILALREATSAGADDALLLDTRGFVACSSVANIVAVMGSRLVTPALAHGVLPGTQRARLLRLAAEAGLAPAEVTLCPADLAIADAVFLTNSLRLLSPVTEIDGTAQAGRTDMLRKLAALILADMPAVPAGVTSG
jgi:branched-chain amino acid aminotransferase